MTVDTVIWHESMDLAQTCCVALFWSQTHENHSTGTPKPTGGNTDDQYAVKEHLRHIEYCNLGTFNPLKTQSKIQ